MFFVKDKNVILFNIHLIVFSIFNFISSNKIIFPFKIEQSNGPLSNYIDKFIQNKLYINIEIGSPPKSINLYLSMDTYYLIIANSSIDSSYYNNKQSNTYSNTSKLNTFFLELFSNGYYAKESFWFRTSLEKDEKNIFKNIEFIHVMSYSSITYVSPGYFGLQIPKANKPNIYNYLKKEKIISKEYWNLKYTSDNEGYFLLGEFPSEYNDENSLRKTNALPCEEDNPNLCWKLKFNDIKFGDINVNRDRIAKIFPEFEFIIGTGEYEQKISENFFKLNNKCQKKLSETNYYYYECENDIDISNFKNLEFSHSEFMFNFIMTKEDLFKLYNNKIYFLIIFNMYSSYGNYWKLGKPFIKKYNFGYNIENKKIYFFYKEEKKEKNEKQRDSNIYYYIIIGFLLLGVFVMAFFVIINKFWKPKRKKANELQEEINISYENMNQNNIGI